MPFPQAIRVESVTARYGQKVALRGLSFEADVGVCALLGPNGAGKTTLMSAIMGIKSFDGSITIRGETVGESNFRTGRRAADVGYLPQRFDLAGGLRVGETVAYAAWCNGQSRTECSELAVFALDKVGLGDKKRHKVRTLSGGERQRLGVACAIAHRPTILLLDEPTVGLDPSQRTKLRKYLRGISETSSTILATHLLEDVQIVADHVLVINHGTVVFRGSKDEMARLSDGKKEEYESPLECAYRLLMSASDDE